MARRRQTEQAGSNGVEDSFLDIVANIIGILILLVLVVGVRAATQPTQTTEAPESEEPLLEILSGSEVSEAEEKLQRKARAIEDLVNSSRELEEQLLISQDERATLATYNAALEEELENKKRKLDADSGERFELRQQLAELDAEAHKLMIQKVSMHSTVSEPKKLVHTPTPMVRRGIEHTVHLQLSKDRIAIAPLKQFEELVLTTPMATRRRDLERGNGVATVGPIDGFVLKYVVVQAFSDPGPMGTRQMKQFTFAELRPVDELLGDLAREALGPGSPVQNEIDRADSRDTAFVIWVFPDSVDRYREIVAHLRKRGFAVDVRLLATGQYIALSSNGREAAAQ